MAGNKIPFIKQWIIVLSILFSSLMKADAIENKIETTRYILKASGRYCAFNLYINDIELFSYHDGFSVSTGTGIGDVLKPKENKIKLEIWDPEKKHGEWRSRAKCEISIQSYDPVNNFALKTIHRINFYPSEQPDLSKLDQLFENTEIIDNQLGKTLTMPSIIYSKEKQLYIITNQFDVKDDFVEWPWYQSPTLPNPLSTEQIQKLHQAYNDVWQALNRKDISKLRELYKEMAYESSMALIDSTEESYFDSIGFQALFEEEDYKDCVFAPVDFENREFIFSLESKVVHLKPSPLLFCHKKDIQPNLNIDNCMEFNPKFRFDGEKFVITR